ncbi:spore germination protein [Paenibacillus sp. J5C_2022]|uniref:spore germination protein n=1 Tax=Paenibacillus sp. J5C2022 TaxID=2977129 RepID=UPI0021CFD187|nr:spore germination protein [Paenibacillus sp. J5C2022]MCU6710772.1 spore germination protein [Paenibacillus sp. J5C2022]
MSSNSNANSNAGSNPGAKGGQSATATAKLNSSLAANVDRIKKTLGNSSDIVIREVGIGKSGEQRMAIIYTDGLADKDAVASFIMESSMLDIEQTDTAERLSESGSALQFLQDSTLTIGEVKPIADFDGLLHSLLSGEAIILLDGYAEGIAAGTRGWKDRGVSEPAAESVIRGPRESFSETLRTNTALLRRKIKDPNLWLETRQIGRVTKTDVSVMFINGIANDGVVEEVRSRLDRIDIDAILESGYIEELIQDKTYTPFPTVYNSERPDVIAAELLEGKVAILVDGTPFVLIVPALFVSFLHAAEDYYHRADISTLVRILRYLGVFIALFGPSLYVAITTYHQEMLPTQLLISLAAQREGIPFPAFIEAIMMEVSFEILREAGLRMPRSIGSAVSIVGTLVIGQAAVEAGIVSAAMVIVVATTAIASFVFPAYSLANTIRMLRFPLMGLAVSFGLFGIIVGVFAILLHLCSLRTFGVPYLSPFAPLIPEDHKDTFFRLPQWAMTTRPRLISQKNIKREQSPDLAKPQPPQPSQPSS